MKNKEFTPHNLSMNRSSVRREGCMVHMGWIRRVVCLLVMVIVVLTCSGCSETTNNKQVDTSDESDRIRIGMCFDSFVIERWQRDRDVFVSVAKEMGAEVNVQNANGEVETQKKQIDYFIDKGMDVIVIICIDSESLTDSVKKAKAAGIKVIAYDRLIRNANVDLYISFDNEMVGTMMAEALLQQPKEIDKVLMLGGPLMDDNVPRVENAFRSVMEQNDIEIMDSFHADGWRAEEAEGYVYQHPNEVDEVDAIMCGNDNLATSTVRALSELRLAGGIPVVGQDADLEACQRIVEGTQIMTVYKPVERLANQAAQCAICLANGEDMEEMLQKSSVSGNEVGQLDMINDGNYYVPYVKLTPISVTKENMNDIIIGSGFHLKEDVYLNVPEQMP